MQDSFLRIFAPSLRLADELAFADAVFSSDLQRFWEELSRAEQDGDFLQLPGGVSALFEGASKALYVRSSYNLLTELVQTKAQLAKQKGTLGLRSIVVTPSTAAGLATRAWLSLLSTWCLFLCRPAIAGDWDPWHRQDHVADPPLACTGQGRCYRHPQPRGDQQTGIHGLSKVRCLRWAFLTASCGVAALVIQMVCLSNAGMLRMLVA